MKILFVDNDPKDFESFCKLPFGEQHAHETTYCREPVGLGKIAAANPDLRLIILDVVWQTADDTQGYPFGVNAMRELAVDAPDIPVVIYSVVNTEEMLTNYIPEMMRLGAYDWISKTESRLLRSFRFERAYNVGRDVLKRPASRAILPIDQQVRSNIHVATLFIDMSGFTALTDKIGASEVVEILRAFYSLTANAVTEYGGYIDKYIGDAVMAVFGASADNDDKSYPHVEKCIQAARLILTQASLFRLQRVEPKLKRVNFQDPPEKIARIGKFRVGIESGPVEVVRFERGNESELTFVGTPVNIASRLLNHAQPGEIWLGVNARNSAGPGAEILETREVEHKNLPGSFQAYLVQV